MYLKFYVNNSWQSLMEYEEHEKRAWSVDFSRTEPSMLVSGSDDCKVPPIFTLFPLFMLCLIWKVYCFYRFASSYK